MTTRIQKKTSRPLTASMQRLVNEAAIFIGEGPLTTAAAEETFKSNVRKAPALNAGQARLVTESFEGLPVVFREDGYINMTKAAKHFKKRLLKFWEAEGTKEYVAALMELLNDPKRGYLVDAKKGRYGGTFCHPKLAVFFARWLDVRFAVWCDLMIDNILKGNIQTTVAVPTQEALDVNAVVAPFKAKILALEDELKAVRAGEVPPDWKTAKVFLVEAGMSMKMVGKIAYEFGYMCSFWSQHHRIEGRSREGNVGTNSHDTNYWHPIVLEAAYDQLMKEVGALG